MRFALTGTVFLLLAGGAAAQERQVWTATCTKAGRTVYRERIADRPSPSKEIEVARRNPGAVCLMLAPEEAGGMPADLASALQQSRPGGGNGPGGGIGPVLSFASPNQPIPDAGIDAALRAIKGTSIPLAARPAETVQEPLRIGVELSTDMQAEVARPAHSDWVRIALYRDVSEDDAIADWARVLAAQPILASYTPDLRHLPGGQIMLALGPVSPGDAAPLCLSLSGLGLDCISGAGTPSVPEEGAALDALAQSYPGLVAWGGGDAICRRGEQAAWAGDGPASSAGPLGPQRPWADLTAVGTGRMAVAAAPAQRGPKGAAGASSSALASNLATSFSTSPKVRPANAFMR